MTNNEIGKELSDTEVFFLTIMGEARGEPIEGQIAVAWVIMNRSIKRKQSIREVCLADRQFSCWNEGDPNRPLLIALAKKIMLGNYDYADSLNKQIQWVVDGVYTGKIKDNTSGSDHYMTTDLFQSEERPRWSKAPLKKPLAVGNHTFLNV